MRSFFRELRRPWPVFVGTMIQIQRMVLWLGMGMVPGREGRLVLGMVRTLRMGVIEGMVLVQFAVTVFVRAGLGSGLWRLGIPGDAVGSASGRHGQIIPLPDDKLITRNCSSRFGGTGLPDVAPGRRVQRDPAE
jgi:hypothetical protein